MNETLTVFAQEARERLEELESLLLDLEQQGSDGETLNAIFRAAHTIKGASGVVEIGPIEQFTHVLENLLDHLREGDVAVSPELVSALLSGGDHIGRLLEHLSELAEGQTPAVVAEGEVLADRLRAFLPGAAAGAPAPTVAAGPARSSDADAPRAGNRHWHVSVRFGESVLRQGMDPAAFLRYLPTVGSVVRMETLADALPPADEMDPEACYLGFEIALAEAADATSIESVFDFVRDDCLLTVLPPHAPLADYAALLDARPEGAARLGAVLVDMGCLSAEALAHVVAAEAVAADDGVALLPALADAASLPAAAEPVRRGSDGRSGQETRLIRVPADKLDRLIDLIGELVIGSASAELFARRSRETALIEVNANVSRLVEDVRDAALQLRMVTIGETFNRFQRVVRDTARELGKAIGLEVRGAETELDKSMVERLGEPLLHLVRNAIDHGIEPQDERLAAGKRAEGRLQLNAFHDSGSVVIEVVDDGRGLDPERIRARAVERGLVGAEQGLTDAEALQLIFEPGFSTVDAVTKLSGRGVGMDVVKRTIAALRGTVDVRSTVGEGTTFVLRLPLTLAIIDGFLVAAGQHNYVIPLDNVAECLELTADDVYGDVFRLRGEPLPLVRLRTLFDLADAPPRRQNVVVVQAGNQRAGIVVDALLGEFQTVIKPLGLLFRNLRGVAGSTIMGNGEVALIVDVPNLVSVAAATQQHAFSDNVRPAVPHVLS
ncbi:chemotaxis protein CheA [Nitrogeniibacter mangrovi]|uniref:Chemotaxis protein CheA n=1 Tax=Nitrogeniibacter mangrovi TaxID=2016596 RepID=A0A6C1B1L6_9RHOO|nr:chemotaxis protein CheA [Nitrogeniibacter mangrovi]QID16805.1 chemotaxis protein CheA [Nitrogeniibacter mangrovi]